MANNKKLENSLDFLPANIKDYPLYPKVSEMVDYIVKDFTSGLEDVTNKYRGELRDEAIKELIQERGFDYIRSVMDTISEFEFKSMQDFLSLISLLKGTRQGLELILRLLGFDSIIAEWWEKEPRLAPQTYEIVIIMNTTYINNVFLTLETVKEFAKHYVFPKIDNVDFRFALSFAEKNINFAGFYKKKYTGKILQRA